MHVRWDWNQLIDNDDYRTVSTLCGKKSSRSLVGIPGITEQPVRVQRRDGSEVNGWCPACLTSLALSIPNDTKLRGVIKPVREAHLLIRAALYEAAPTVTNGWQKPYMENALERTAG